MALNAARQTSRITKQLKARFKESGRSLRELCSMTMGLEIPERIHHSNLSKMLNRIPGHNLYVQQALVMLNLINLDITAVIRDWRDREHAVAATELLDLVAAADKNTVEKMLRLLRAASAEAGIEH